MSTRLRQPRRNTKVVEAAASTYTPKLAERKKWLKGIEKRHASPPEPSPPPKGPKVK